MNRRNLTLIATAVALLALLAWGFMPGPLLVDAVEVQRGRLELTVAEEGETRLRRRYRVDAPVAGTVSRIDLDVGDVLAADAVIARLEPTAAPLLDPRRRAEAEAALARAEAALGGAEQELTAAAAAADLARLDLDRLRELYARGDASEAALDLARGEARRSDALRGSAEYAVQVARHERSAAEAVLRVGGEGLGEPVDVTSPIDGRVLRVFRESRGVVAPAEPLVEVGDIGSLEVQVDVLSSDAVRITEGMAVRLNRWGGESPLEGQVRRIEPVGFTKVSALGVEEQRVLVIVDITSSAERWARLGDGYRVEAEFILWADDDVLQVPTSSLFRHDGGWAVFLVDDDVARLRMVEAGQRSGLAAEVRSGLAAGGRVITHPPDALADGRAVDWRR